MTFIAGYIYMLAIKFERSLAVIKFHSAPVPGIVTVSAFGNSILSELAKMVILMAG